MQLSDYAIDSDFFEQFRPFPKEPSSVFEAHWHEIVGSIVFYQLIMSSSPYLCGKFFGTHYTDLKSKSKKLNFDIHLVALVQSLISIFCCVSMFCHPMYKENPALGTYPFGGFVASITVGYFIWDFFICIIFFKEFGFQFLIHAIGALYVFSCTFLPFMQPYIPVFLIFELSSPFVNLNWFASRLPADNGIFSEKFVLINGLLLMISFFSVRILWGFYSAYASFFVIWEKKEHFPVFIIPSVYGLNITLNVLNLFWFQKMVSIASKKLKASKKKD